MGSDVRLGMRSEFTMTEIRRINARWTSLDMKNGCEVIIIDIKCCWNLYSLRHAQIIILAFEDIHQSVHFCRPSYLPSVHQAKKPIIMKSQFLNKEVKRLNNICLSLLKVFSL